MTRIAARPARADETAAARVDAIDGRGHGLPEAPMTAERRRRGALGVSRGNDAAWRFHAAIGARTDGRVAGMILPGEGLPAPAEGAA